VWQKSDAPAGNLSQLVLDDLLFQIFIEFFFLVLGLVFQALLFASELVNRLISPVLGPMLGGFDQIADGVVIEVLPQVLDHMPNRLEASVRVIGQLPCQAGPIDRHLAGE